MRLETREWVSGLESVQEARRGHACLSPKRLGLSRIALCAAIGPRQARVAALALFLFLPGSAPLLAQIDLRPTVPESTGLNIHFTDPRPGEMAMLAATGVRWVRADLIWAKTEKTKGQYDFSAYDRLLAALQPYHIRAMLILCCTNPLYDDNLSPHTEEGRRAFAGWAAAAVAHLRGRGVMWEMYNEPNWPAFWRPKPKVEDYIKLALAVGEAIEETAPGELYVGPATAVVDPAFLEACFRAGLLNYWSAVTVHPYRQMNPETAANAFTAVRALIAKYAPPGKTVPIVAGEWGYPSAWNWDGMDQAKQAKLLTREWLSDLQQQVPLTIWYEWRDDALDPTNDPKNYEEHFGLVLADYAAGRSPVYTPKPAYVAARSLNTFFEGFRLSESLKTGDPDDRVLLFERRREFRLAAWTTGAPHRARIPSRLKPVEMLGYDGRKLTPPKAGRRDFLLNLTDAPVYVRLARREGY